MDSIRQGSPKSRAFGIVQSKNITPLEEYYLRTMTHNKTKGTNRKEIQMNMSTYYEILLNNKADKPSGKGIEYHRKIWETYLELMGYVSTKYRPTLHFVDDVTMRRKTPTRVGVLFFDQGHGIDYADLMIKLMGILHTRISYLQSHHAVPLLAEQLTRLLAEFAGMEIVPADTQTIKKISDQIDKLVHKYRDTYTVEINTLKHNEDTAVSIPPQGSFFSESKTDLPGGTPINTAKGITPPPESLLIEELAQPRRGRLVRLGFLAGEPSVFYMSDKKRTELLLDEMVRLQVMDNPHKYHNRELSLEYRGKRSNTVITLEPVD